MNAVVKIDCKKRGPKISPLIFGHFIENMARCIYGGGLLKRSGDVRADIIKPLNEMGVSILRWPGGLFADGYDWRNGIGRTRPVMPNRYWGRFGRWLGRKDPNFFGTDEFLALCSTLRARPYLNVNYGTSTPENAANWVQYCNGSPDSEYGKRRVANGHSEPWNVKTWGIGNETFGFWAYGYGKPGDYAERYLKFYEAMHAEDQSILPVVVGACDLYPDWNKKVLDVIGNQAAYLSLHVYLPALNQPKYFLMRVPGTREKHYSLSAGYLELDRKIKVMARDIERSLGPHSKMKIALDEWNLWWWWPQVYKVWWKMRDAVSLAGMAGAIFENCDTVALGNLAQAVNVLGLLQSDYNQVVRTPSYYVMQMFHDILKGDKLDCTVESPTFSTRKLGGIPAASDVPYISSYGAIDGNKIGVLVVQRRYEGQIRLKVAAPGVDFQTMKILSAPSPEASNTFKHPKDVGIRSEPIHDGQGGLDILLPAASVVTFKGIVTDKEN